MNLSYPYKANPMKMAISGLFFAACAAILFRNAVTNDRGLIINGLFELGPQGADVFYGVLAALSVGFVLVAAIATVQGLIKNPVLELTDEYIIIPSGFIRKRTRVVRFTNITRIGMQEVQKQRFLILWHHDGKSSIVRSMLASDTAFDEVTSFIRERTPHLAGSSSQ